MYILHGVVTLRDKMSSPNLLSGIYKGSAIHRWSSVDALALKMFPPSLPPLSCESGVKKEQKPITSLIRKYNTEIMSVVSAEVQKEEEEGGKDKINSVYLEHKHCQFNCTGINI